MDDVIYNYFYQCQLTHWESHIWQLIHILYVVELLLQNVFTYWITLVRCIHFPTRQNISHFTTFTVSLGLENCKFSLNKPQGLQYTLLFLWDSGNFFEALGICVKESILKRLQKASVLVSWQRSALILWQWRNCQFSVIGREMVFLLNAFLDIVPL